MVRNIVLLFSTAGVMAVLAVGYWTLTRVPDMDPPRSEEILNNLPAENIQRADDVLEFSTPQGSARIHPGEPMSLTIYREGLATDRVRVENWQKVPGTDDLIELEQPEFAMLMPGGMTATISAHTARISIDEVEQSSMTPRAGWFEGDASIVIDRNARSRPPDTDPRPEDLIRIEMPRFDFDLELGELRSEGRVTVTSSDFEISGTGMHLLWNQADNRVERLEIKQDGRLSVMLGGGFFSQLSPEKNAASADETHAPTKTPRTRKPRTAYLCTLTGDVQVDQVVGSESRAGLRAARLSMLFDLGGASGAAPAAEPTTQPASQAATSRPTSAPSSAATPRPIERLVVRWSGPLELSPTEPSAEAEPPRRRIEAAGGVRLSLGERVIDCDKLVYHDDTQRLWLRPKAAGRVQLSAGGKFSVAADSIFLDRRANIIKLIGDVVLRSLRPEQGLSVECALWAELRLAAEQPGATGDAADADLLDAGALESAKFVGNVRVRVGGRELYADHLETFFAKKGTDASLEAGLERARAGGEVRLVETPPLDQFAALRVVRQTLSTAVRTALGGSRERRARVQSLTCGWLDIGFAHDESGTLYARDADARGAVVLRDPRRRVAARGRRLIAQFATENEIETATIIGSDSDPARMVALSYNLRGKQIELSESEQSLTVRGPSRLKFLSTRSLQGKQRRGTIPVVVTCQEILRVDGRPNPDSGADATIHFAGDVLARSADERIESDVLTLELQRTPDQDAAGTQVSAASAYFSNLRRQLLGGAAADPRASEPPAREGRLDLARVAARNALIVRETPGAAGAAPLTHQSINTPELRIDAAARRMQTTGVTQLIMTTHQAAGTQAGPDALGVPSALMSAGPSQTAIVCDRSLTYVLGDDSPERRDTAILEGNVRFVRVAGEKLIELEPMLGDIVNDPRLLTKYGLRHTVMLCEQLTTEFSSAGGAAQSSGLARLNAGGDVELIDTQNATVRSIYAHRIEFDRVDAVIRIVGDESEGIDARIFDENLATGRVTPIASSEITIDMNSGTIRTGKLRGSSGG